MLHHCILTIGFFFLSGLSGIIFSQEEAFYLADYYEQEDLYRVKIKDNSYYIQETFSFQDSLQPVNSVITRLFLTDSLFPDSTDLFSEWAGKYDSFIDSVQVDGNWYQIKSQFHDNGFIGGSPPTIQQKIEVSNIGIIYNSSQFGKADVLIMLCHSDNLKQKILEKTYQRLADRTEWNQLLWFNWKKCAELSSIYHFSDCVQRLNELWSGKRNDLRLIKSKSDYKNKTGHSVHYSVEIKNCSETNYYISKQSLIAPSRVIIKYENTEQDYDLLKTKYGQHFQRLNQQYCINSGKTLKIEFDFQVTGCNNGACKDLLYEGLQFYPNWKLSSWLFAEPVFYNDKTYSLFPFREINPL